MKLSKAQKKVIEKMREGKVLHKGAWVRFVENASLEVSKQTFFMLLQKNLIEKIAGHSDINTAVYQLTTLGKTIELK